MGKNETLTLQHYKTESDEPDENLVLWRYVDFPKFLDLLSTSSLTMPRASMMEDGYEGLLGEAAVDARLEKFRMDREPGYLRNASINYELRNAFFWRERTHISCWNAFPVENAGLWRIYGDEKGIAIKTTWRRLKKSLLEAGPIKNVFYGSVEYQNYSTYAVAPNNYTDHYFTKRMEFSHESEFRLVAHNVDENTNYNDEVDDLPAVASIKCDLSVLIEELIVSPRLGEWTVSGIEETCRRFGGKWKVRQSELYKEPSRTISKF